MYVQYDVYARAGYCVSFSLRGLLLLRFDEFDETATFTVTHRRPQRVFTFTDCLIIQSPMQIEDLDKNNTSLYMKGET